MIVWTNQYVFNRAQLNKAITYARNNMKGFLPLASSELNKLKTYSRNNAMPLGTLLSIRRHLQIQLAIYTRQPPNIDQIIRDELTHLDETLIKSSDTEVVRQLTACLLRLNVPLTRIYKVIKVDFSDYKCQKMVYYLNEFFLKVRKESDLVLQKSKRHEKKLQAYLTSMNVAFETEEELKDRGVALTPDIFLTNPITIQVAGVKHTIKWLDAKDYALTPGKYFIDHLKEQGQKYVTAYGPGAFVFNNGIDESTKIDGVIMLDGTFLYL